jgi:Domain of unknown function (DUF4126)
MESIAFVATSWASGVNAYLTLLILGVAGRYGWAETPTSLQQGWVIIVAGVAFVVEFVVDKVPLLDSAWDAVHTIIRPVVGGLSGVAIAGASFGKPQAFIAAAALALTGHATKATSRLAINMSPEPFTNIIASFAEDGIVAGLVPLAIAYPKISAAVGAVVAVIGACVALLLVKLARKGLRRVRSWAGASTAT